MGRFSWRWCPRDNNKSADDAELSSKPFDGGDRRQLLQALSVMATGGAIAAMSQAAEAKDSSELPAPKRALTGRDQAGKSVFVNNGCNSCHTLKAAGATGKIGPDLDKLPQEAQGAGKPLEQFVHTSIVDPNAYVQKGYPKNVMPPFANLPKDQLDALVQYLIQSSKKG